MTSKIDYVIALRDTGGMRIQYRTKLVLPDAEHIHLHHRPDGTWSAVPMLRKVRDHQEKCDIWSGWACVCGAPWLWVDAPVQGDNND